MVKSSRYVGEWRQGCERCQSFITIYTRCCKVYYYAPRCPNDREIRELRVRWEARGNWPWVNLTAVVRKRMAMTVAS
jgi:hypothetical protein